MNIFQHNSQKGQTLIEILVALGIISIVISSITYIMTSSLQNAQFGRDQSQATQYAQEGIEVIRQLRDSDYNTFTAYSGGYCLDKNAQLPTSGTCTQANVDTYIRKVTFTKNSCATNVTKVAVDVNWSDGKCTNAASTFCHNVQLTTCLSDYVLVPTP